MTRRSASDRKESSRSVIYARYSTHNQKDLSIEQQVEQAQKLAAERGFSVVEIYADRALTGKNDKRPSFQKMLKDAAAGLFSYVVAWKSNRIGRNMLEAMLNEQRFRDLGVRFVYVEEDFDDSAAGRFAARSMMNVNQFYSENMAEDIKRGMNSNASRCMVASGRLPLGYKADADLRWILDEDRAPVVLEIFERVADGDLLSDIARDLNARGIKTSSGADWGKSSFSVLLRNERYRGIYIYDEIRVEGGIPRIVPDELFYKVQEVLKVKKSVRGRHSPFGDYALTGKLFCGLCGSAMTGMSGVSKSGAPFHYYVCSKKRREHACDKKNVRKDEIEQLVADAIREHILTDEIIDWIAYKTMQHNKKVEKENHLGALEDQLAASRSAAANVMKAIEAGIITPTTKSRLCELEKECADLEHRIAAARADVIVITRDQIVETLQLYRAGDFEDPAFRAQLFDTFLTAVYVFDDNLRIVFSFCGDKNAREIPFDADLPDDPADALASVRTSSPTRHQNGARRTPRLFEADGIFVLLLPLSQRA